MPEPAPDLALSKFAAGREKDLDFVSGLLRHRLLQPEQVEALLPELNAAQLELVRLRLALCRRRVMAP